MNPVGQIVRTKREKAGLSQNALAKKAGISQASLNALEAKTNNPSVETVFLLADALECSVSELLGEKCNGEVFLSERQKYLLSIYSQLNDSGKLFLLQQAESILQQPSFRQEGSMLSAM